MNEDIKGKIETMGAAALSASRELSTLETEKKNQILMAMADQLMADADTIIEANGVDISAAEQNGLTSAMIDRLRLDESRVESIADGIRQVASLPDPVGQIMDDWERPNGMRIRQLRVPIGVIGIIYESRPNVTSDAAVLCLKTGNATILRGGKESIHSNKAIAASLQSGGELEGLPKNSIQLIPFTERESVKHLAQMDQYLDLIIPRGGAGLIEAVVSMARMPVIKHYDGICHLYIDDECDPEMARKLVIDSKTQKPSVCNALETLLISEQVAETLLPLIASDLTERNVELRCDERSLALIGSSAVPATDDDWRAEYLDLILSIKVVEGIDEAVRHINEYGSHHSDCIVTVSESKADQFMSEIDSATVFWNVSTRFSDGEEFGFGAEIGISTDKLHARGPMALRELTSYKYLITGNGQTKV
ncbi:MAG: glutamate-5-semialdehyde dehydrogenase [Verrucomicrobiales bacterium]|nr:glutamate-5-semialdehyde dehydrogenase [Verrucomicrobiales bacterium]|tara:strand:+ start:1243 stop:2508 length:1266 start_codon:yes stop_codon:yes gene_type:complete